MKSYKDRICPLLSGMILVVIFAQQTAFAQATQQEKVVNSLGSVLHEWTKEVADSILAALGFDIRFSVLYTTKSSTPTNSAISPD